MRASGSGPTIVSPVAELPKLRLSVCKGSDCRLRGADAVFVRAKELVQLAGLGSRCDVRRGGCYGQCAFGPNVVVRHAPDGALDPLSSADYQLYGTPDEAHYAAMTPEKVARVVAEHVGEGRKVEELLFDLRKAVFRPSGS